MKREHMEQIVTCPKCGATCKLGNDDDGMVFCANCWETFRPRVITMVNQREYQELTEKAIKRMQKGGWVAYIFD